VQTGKGRVNELILLDGIRQASIICRADLIPAPGQYLLASDGSNAPVPVPLFHTESTPEGFIASPAMDTWVPGSEFFLRGPVGRGFGLPATAKKVALVISVSPPSTLRGLIPPALKQDAAIVLLTDFAVDNLPDEIEIQPLKSINEILGWADYAAFDVSREALAGLVRRLEASNLLSRAKDAQVFVRAPMPCGGLADCGVCAVVAKSGWMMACKDGPVFDLSEF